MIESLSDGHLCDSRLQGQECQLHLWSLLSSAGPPVLPSSVAFNVMSFMQATPRSTSPFPLLARVLRLSSQQPTGGCTHLGAPLNPHLSQQTQTPPGAPLLKPSHLPHAPRHLGCPETPLTVCPWWVATLVSMAGWRDKSFGV